LRAIGAELIGVPMDGAGMDMEALERVLRDTPNVKCIYTIPTFQNPGGTTLPLDRRVRMLELARQYDVLILEDDPYCELRYAGETISALKSMDDSGRVIYLGSYSKIISPGLRVGFVCAPRDVIAKMTTVKQVTDVHTNQFFQMAISGYLDRYDLDAHIAQCCALYAPKLERMYGHIAAWGDTVSCVRPDGGLFLWCNLPQGFDSAALCRLAGTYKVAVVPGATFSDVQGAVSPGFRLNFSLPSIEQIDEGMGLLTKALEEYWEENSVSGGQKYKRRVVQ